MKKLNRVYIEITNICNKNCSFCIQNDRPNQMMTPEQFEIILQKLQGYTTNIYLHVLGEPLLHPQLKEILLISKNYRMNVNITTNGTLLQKQKQLLLQAPALRKISVSMHSYEEVDNSPYYQEVLDFVIESSKKGIFSELRLWNLGVFTLDNSPVLQIVMKTLSLSKEKIEEIMNTMNETGNTTLLPKLFLGKQPRFVWPSMDLEKTNEPIFCHALRSQVAILVDGTVVPCCLDSKGCINLGNILEQDFQAIIDSPRAKAMHQGFSCRQASEELCKRCQYATRF